MTKRVLKKLIALTFLVFSLTGISKVTEASPPSKKLIDRFLSLKSNKKRPGRGPSSTSPSNESANDDAFDPFADFSEFETNPSEQEDLNFFKNGRMLTAGVTGGLMNFTEEMSLKYASGIRYGVFMNYFFDLHFAAQVHWLLASAPATFRAPSNTLTGTAALSTIGIEVRYFLNTQNVTKGLADLNPYFSMGLNSHTLTTNFSGQSGHLKDAATGFSGAMGLEIPLLRKQLFWGLQMNYELVSFQYENSDFIFDSVNYGSSKGDIWNILSSIGFNF